MFEKPQAEHAWLDQLVGQWISEGECTMGPGQETQRNTGRMNCRSLGGMWLICDMVGTDPEGGEWSSVMTLGYDVRKQCYVGTFVAAGMTHLWPYKGVLDASGKKLPLESEGPKMTGEGMAKYRDSIGIVDKNNWTFTGELLGDDGQWHTLMTSRCRRA